MHQEKQSWDLPGSPVVKSLSSNAGDTGSIPGQGTKIPHASGQLSTSATNREPCTLQWRAHVTQGRPSTAKKKEKEKKNYVPSKSHVIQIYHHLLLPTQLSLSIFFVMTCHPLKTLAYDSRLFSHLQFLLSFWVVLVPTQLNLGSRFPRLPHCQWLFSSFHLRLPMSMVTYGPCHHQNPIIS